ncbi:MAG TPA: ABC transporter ATP-binding protein [Pyrinomonadaceae bacterium]
MLSIRGLSKTYANGVQALRDVSLEVAPGMFGLLGPNGAGKTTLMKILATLLDADAGAVEVAGIDFIRRRPEARRVLGYLPQEFGLYPTLTAEQTLDYFARLKGVADARERRALVGALLERVNLAAERAQQVGGFSGGMRQRLGIAQALIGRQKLLVVDEPTAGLDPEERVRFHNLLAEIADDEAVVLLSTHIVSDVSSLCARMAVIRRGRIVAATTPREALASVAGSVWEATVERERAAGLRKSLRVISSQAFEGRVRLRALSPGARPGEEFAPAQPTLEDYYLGLTARPESLN